MAVAIQWLLCYRIGGCVQVVVLIDTVFSTAIATAFFLIPFLLIWLIWHAVRLSHMPHRQGFYSVDTYIVV